MTDGLIASKIASDPLTYRLSWIAGCHLRLHGDRCPGDCGSSYRLRGSEEEMGVLGQQARYR